MWFNRLTARGFSLMIEPPGVHLAATVPWGHTCYNVSQIAERWLPRNWQVNQAGCRYMPIYEYRCEDCQHLNSVLVYSWSKDTDRACSRCNGSNLQRLVSRFSVRRSWGESLNWAPSGETLTDVNEDDPASLDRFMGRIKQEMGGQVTSDFEGMRRELHSGPRSVDGAGSSPSETSAPGESAGASSDG